MDHVLDFMFADLGTLVLGTTPLYATYTASVHALDNGQ